MCLFVTDDCNRETQIVNNALKMILPVTLIMTMMMIHSANGIQCIIIIRKCLDDDVDDATVMMTMLMT